ncbi:MAG: hypothetical protein ABI882_23880 [Acidobacteriota bacterium]
MWRGIESGKSSRDGWLSPVVEFFVAFALIALDQISADLKSPFLAYTLNRLPLD